MTKYKSHRTVSKRGSKAFNLLFLRLIFLGCLLAACSSATNQSHPRPSPTVEMVPSPTPSPIPSPTPTVPQLIRPDLERGMVYPGWDITSYGATDTTWRTGIQTMKKQTAAQWIEMPTLFAQNEPGSTDVFPGSNTPTLAAFVSGIRAAHALGYEVFYTPLEGVNVADGWSGIINFGTEQEEQAWFDSFWNTLEPYAVAAQQNGVEQMAIGTELDWLQRNAPASLWNQLIARVHSVFHGLLTYDMDWPNLSDKPASWLKNPDLSMLGISDYISLTDAPYQVDPKYMPATWRVRVGQLIDTLSQKTGKKIILSEVGFRNDFDGTYNPWNPQSDAPVEMAQQASAYDAVLQDTFADQNIVGDFFWGWYDVGRLDIAGQTAVQVVHKWYTLKG